MRKAKVSSKGQITIPVRFRERMNLTPSREVELEQLEDGSVVIRPKKSIMHLAGAFRPKGKVLPFKEERRIAREAIADRHRRIIEQSK